MSDTPVLRAQVNAWAKINLDLRILAREESGFHQLETMFQRISLSDDMQVQVERGAGIMLTCTPTLDIADEHNLAARAAAVYRHAAHWPAVDQSITITLRKTIPAGAGLGGGSADAGAVLRALNALNPRPMAAAELLTLAATLGADVPFLTTETVRALAWGRGERMLALDALPQRMVRYASFRDGVNTAMAYRALADARAEGRIPSAGSAMLDAHSLGSWRDLQRHARNDFETPVFSLRPDIAAVHAQFVQAAPSALVRMSGSGATVYAITSAHADAFLATAAQWPADGGVELGLAVTLESVPPVQILSVASGPR